MMVIVDALDSFTYNILQAFTSTGQSAEVVRFDSLSFEQLRSMSPRAVVLSPGPGRPEEVALHMAVARSNWQVPVLGVCLGHQALVAASGGDVVRAREPLHGEVSHCRHDGSALFDGVPKSFAVGRYHSLVAAADSLPLCWRVTAVTEEREIMAVEHTRLPRWGVQFHPESVLTPEGPLIIRNFINAALSLHRTT